MDSNTNNAGEGPAGGKTEGNDDAFAFGARIKPLQREEVISPDVPPVAIPQMHFAGETEALLKGIIAECHLMMRQVALPSMCASHDSQTRRDFMDTAMGLARTAAGVAETIGHLRGGIESAPRPARRKQASGA